MADIAQEANVTRQTVYNSFPNTDEVLRAAIRLYIEDQWQKIKRAWIDCSDLGAQLDILFQHFAIEPWEFINSSAEAAELEHGYNEAGRAEVAASRLGFRKEVAAIFSPYESILQKRETSSLAVADMLGWAIEGIKHNSDNKATMMEAVSTLKAALIALTQDTK